MRNAFLFQIAKGIWFIEPTAAAQYRPLVEAIMRGESVKGLMPSAENYNESDSELQMKLKMCSFVSAKNAYAHSTTKDINKAPSGSVAITPLSGVVMKDNFCGSPGTKTLTSWMQEADQNQNIIGHILHVDSPGGSVDGTMDFSESIKTLNKPVVTFVDGMMASAAYWAGSSGKHIMAANPINEIGSIGTYFSFDDYTEADKAAGIKNITVYATKSTEKNIDVREAVKGNTTPLQARVDRYNEAFLNSVIRNRHGKGLNQSQTLKGQLLMTEDAINSGLIDSMGSFQDAINKVIKLSK